jgi:hypothetical protein
MKPFSIVFLTAMFLALPFGACATRPAAPMTAAPGETMRLEEDLVGRFVGRGAFKPNFGAERGVEAALVGTWDAATATLTLEEDFVYSDGVTDRKTWVFNQTGTGEWEGTREDVVGKARGYEDGAAFRLEYLVELGGRKVGFRDVLIEQPDGSILNIASVGWRGLPVGTVELLITQE